MPRTIMTRRSTIHGNGVFAVRDIARGETIIRYRGRLITHAVADRRYGDGGDTGHTFLFTLNDHYVIDANVGGNAARWINHSCAPNCEAVHDEDEHNRPERDRVLIEAKRAIRKGEELTYNYGIVLEVPHTAKLKRIWRCLCGAPRCRGTMLGPKRAPKTKRTATR
jgi:hypothetical protein